MTHKRVLSTHKAISLRLEGLGRWEYATPHEFAEDVRQVFTNCRLFNAPDQEVVVMGNTLEVRALALPARQDK